MTSTDQSGPELDAMRFYYDHAVPHRVDLVALRRETLGRLPEARPAGGRASGWGRGVRAGLLATAGAGLAVLAVVAITMTMAGHKASVVRPPAQAGAIPGTATAGDALRLVAARTGNAPAVTVAAGSYVYTDYRAVQLGKAPAGKDVAWYTSTTRIQTWATPDGLAPVRMVITTGLDARPLTDGDAAKLAGTTFPWRAQRTTTYPGPQTPSDEIDPASGGDLTVPGLANPTPAYLASLPSDPDALLATIREQLPQGKPDASGEAEAQLVFRTVATLVTKADALLRPELRSALYRALATLPGITRQSGTTDLDGRTGIAISRTGDGARFDLILDPASSRVIGVRQVLVEAERGVPAGTVQVLSSTDQRIVGKLGATS